MMQNMHVSVYSHLRVSNLYVGKYQKWLVKNIYPVIHNGITIFSTVLVGQLNHRGTTAYEITGDNDDPVTHRIESQVEEDDFAEAMQNLKTTIDM